MQGWCHLHPNSAALTALQYVSGALIITYHHEPRRRCCSRAWVLRTKSVWKQLYAPSTQLIQSTFCYSCYIRQFLFISHKKAGSDWELWVICTRWVWKCVCRFKLIISNDLDSLADNSGGGGGGVGVKWIHPSTTVCRHAVFFFYYFIGQQDPFSGSEALNQVELQL